MIGHEIQPKEISLTAYPHYQNKEHLTTIFLDFNITINHRHNHQSQASTYCKYILNKQTQHQHHPRREQKKYKTKISFLYL